MKRDFDYLMYGAVIFSLSAMLLAAWKTCS